MPSQALRTSGSASHCSSPARLPFSVFLMWLAHVGRVNISRVQAEGRDKSERKAEI